MKKILNIVMAAMMAMVLGFSSLPAQAEVSAANVAAAVFAPSAVNHGPIIKAIYCKQQIGEFCYQYAPSPLPGFVNVPNGTTAAINQVVMCDQYGDCARDQLGVGGFYNLASLGDWYPGGSYFIKSWSSYLHGQVQFFSGTSWTGSSCTLSAGYYYNLSDVQASCGFKPASIKMQN